MKNILDQAGVNVMAALQTKSIRDVAKEVGCSPGVVFERSQRKYLLLHEWAMLANHFSMTAYEYGNYADGLGFIMADDDRTPHSFGVRPIISQLLLTRTNMLSVPSMSQYGINPLAVGLDALRSDRFSTAEEAAIATFKVRYPEVTYVPDIVISKRKPLDHLNGWSVGDDVILNTNGLDNRYPGKIVCIDGREKEKPYHVQFVSEDGNKLGFAYSHSALEQTPEKRNSLLALLLSPSN